MELTGKCKEEFEKWFSKTYSYHGNQSTPPLEKVPYDDIGFYNYNSSMKYGVYVDFFDSVGMHIQLTPYFDSVKKVMLWFFTLENKRCVHLNSHLENKDKTRPEARASAIEKANEIYNLNQ
tara:strand:+ start:177 stop:539 length:363 start_codon:yes stop_codon:yes gene_type:complete